MLFASGAASAKYMGYITGYIIAKCVYNLEHWCLYHRNFHFDDALVFIWLVIMN